MRDLINRQATIDAICTNGVTAERDRTYVITIATAKQRAVDIIERLPTIDAVPVVRCKDCRNWERLSFDADSGCYCPFVDRYTTDDWYCADGERRDDE